MGIRDVKAVTFAGSIYMQRAKHKLPKQQENTNIKIPLSFLCCFFFLSSVVLNQSFTKGKGRHHLLLTYSNVRDCIRALPFYYPGKLFSNVTSQCCMYVMIQ